MMNMLELFGFDTSSPLNRSQKIHRENERSNLLIVTRLVLRTFLEETMKLRHRMLETDTQPLADLFMMLEKVLWHGFKSTAHRTMIALRSPDAELWACIGRIASTHADMNECYQCITQLGNITTPVARIRAMLRLGVMQKKLADYFQHMQSSKYLKEYYEPWALIRQEECVSLSGALVGLSVLDCNLLLDQDHLQEQTPSIDLAAYIRLPTIPLSEEDKSNGSEESTSPDSLKTLLDQKSFLEERNRFLEKEYPLRVNASNMKKKLDELEQKKDSVSEQKVSMSEVNEPQVVDTTITLETVTKERDQLAQVVSEKEDSVRTLKQQLADTKKVNVDLYEKIRLIEDKCRKFERDLITAKQHHTQEKEQMRRTIEALKSHNSARDSEIERTTDASEMLKNELANKTEAYMQTLSILSQKQEELSAANEDLQKLNRTNSELSEKLKRMPVMEQEFEELKSNYAFVSQKLEDYEKALEELGGHLSEYAHFCFFLDLCFKSTLNLFSNVYN
ncbi:unnamed protein product [Anisakis simplex]|uniref:RUN domain-containing protein n=2 Tax=Anisakis simplex TaxID=6269 RepID=A0A0M3IZB8_ANISI|nr:unnamed protein product [Anisakis simplex]